MTLYLVPVSVIEDIKEAICKKVYVYDKDKMTIKDFAYYISQIYY